MPITIPTLTPAQKQLNDKKLQDLRVKNLQQQGWGRPLGEPRLEEAGGFGEQNNNSALSNAQQEYNNWQFFLNNPKAEDITVQNQSVDIPVTIEVPFQQAIDIAKKEAEAAERRSAEDMAAVVEAQKIITQSREFSASGSLSFSADQQFSESAEPVFLQTSNPEIGEIPAATESTEIPISRNSGQAEHTEIWAAEPLIEDSHTRQPQEFTQNTVDLVRHHSDLDFPYFFGWLGGKIETILKPVIGVFGKVFTHLKSWWKETKKTVIDDLIVKQIFGLGPKKKEISKEEQAKQKLQAANKRNFFNSLRAASGVMGADKRRNLRSRLETLNKSLKRGNLSYEGDLDSNGQINANALMEEELANSKMSQEQLLADKKKKLMMATPAKAKSGPGVTMSADKSHNFNNAAKLAG